MSTLNDVLTSTVYDRNDEKVGKVEQVYIDNASDLPTWVSVRTGFFGTSHSLVPLANATHSKDHLNVAVSKDRIKAAPHLDSAEGIDSKQTDELLKHYGLTSATSGWQGYGKHAAAPAPAGKSTHGAPTAPGKQRAETTADSAATHADSTSIVRSEERLSVGTERVSAGTARLRKYVVTDQQTVNVPVSHEEVRVVREPVHGEHKGAKIGDDSAEVVLHEDRVHVSKDTVPVERVGLAVNEVTKDHAVAENVRKERIEADGIESADADRKPSSKKTS